MDPVSLGSIQHITKARQTIGAKVLEKDKTPAAEILIGQPARLSGPLLLVLHTRKRLNSEAQPPFRHHYAEQPAEPSPPDHSPKAESS